MIRRVDHSGKPVRDLDFWKTVAGTIIIVLGIIAMLVYVTCLVLPLVG